MPFPSSRLYGGSYPYYLGTEVVMNLQNCTLGISKWIGILRRIKNVLCGIQKGAPRQEQAQPTATNMHLTLSLMSSMVDRVLLKYMKSTSNTDLLRHELQTPVFTQLPCQKIPSNPTQKSGSMLAPWGTSNAKSRTCDSELIRLFKVKVWHIHYGTMV